MLTNLAMKNGVSGMATKISDKVIILTIPEKKIMKDFGITEDVIWDKIPESLVVGFFAKHYKHFHIFGRVTRTCYPMNGIRRG